MKNKKLLYHYYLGNKESLAVKIKWNNKIGGKTLIFIKQSRNALNFFPVNNLF